MITDQKFVPTCSVRSLSFLIAEESFSKLFILNRHIISHIMKKEIEVVTDFIFLGSKPLQMVTAAMKLKDACPLEEKI